MCQGTEIEQFLQGADSTSKLCSYQEQTGANENRTTQNLPSCFCLFGWFLKKTQSSIFDIFFVQTWSYEVTAIFLVPWSHPPSTSILLNRVFKWLFLLVFCLSLIARCDLPDNLCLCKGRGFAWYCSGLYKSLEWLHFLRPATPIKVDFLSNLAGVCSKREGAHRESDPVFPLSPKSKATSVIPAVEVLSKL